ncbi:hypothetical protein UlMin_001791 [Ulmus minor]
MADVMSHGGDSGGDPPQRGGSRLPTQCESSQPRKTRGAAKGLKLQSAWQANQGKPLPVEFDWRQRTITPIGPNSELVSRFISSHLKQNVRPYYTDWDEVPAHFKEQLWNAVQSYFDMQRDYSEAQLGVLRMSIDRTAKDRYRDYKYKVHCHFKKEGAEIPFKQMSDEDWAKCIQLFSSEKFRERSEKNKANREKSRYPSLHGTRTYAAARHAKRNPETQQLPSIVESFKTYHTTKKGQWVNEVTEQDYARLTQELETQTQEAASSSVEVDEHEVTRRVLGERRGHQRAVGRLLRGDGSSFATTAASHAHFAHGSSSAQPSYEQVAAALADSAAARAETERYKNKLDSMEKNIALLVAQLQSRMPDIQYPGIVPPYPQPGPNAEGDEDEEEDADDEDLRED